MKNKIFAYFMGLIILNSIGVSASTSNNDRWFTNKNGTMSYMHNDHAIKDRIAILSDGIYGFNSNGEKVINSWYSEKNGDSDTWYYLGNDGKVLTGWQQIGGRWYYFDLAEGVMKVNTKVDGYKLGVDGAWIN